MNFAPLAVATLLLAIAGPAAAQTAVTVTVTDAWARATPAGTQTGAAYLTLTSPAGDKLVGVTSPAAKTAQVHEMTMDGTIMRMREVSGLDLPPGKPVRLDPGGLHIMLTGLVAPLKRGQTLHLHLIFAHGSPVDVDAPIGAIGASAMPGGAAMRMP